MYSLSLLISVTLLKAGRAVPNQPKGKPKNREELAQGFYKQTKKMAQNQLKLAAGEISDDDLWERAYQRADEWITKRNAPKDTRDPHEEEDLEFRQSQEESYRKDFDWATANDEISLQMLLDWEVESRRIMRRLNNPTISAAEKEALRDGLRNIIDSHRKLQESLGIDRKAREGKRSAENPMTDWERIKQQATAKMNQMQEDLFADLDKAGSEFDIRNAIKYRLGYPFKVVDAILSKHRVVLGLSPNIEIPDETN